MSLFNDLVKYTENEDDGQAAVLDRDLKNSVLGELLLVIRNKILFSPNKQCM